MIYLDNAATSWPKPESVYLAMDRFLREQGGNPGRGGHSMAMAARQEIETTRRLAARFFGVPEFKRIVFTLNCTDAINLGLKGLLKPGDHVITDAIGHNSLSRPLHKLENRGIISVTRISPDVEIGVVTSGQIEKAITPRTSLVAMTHASNVTGAIQPIPEHGRIASAYGIAFMVDAAQTAGKHPLDVVSSHIDLLACSGHKGLLGPPGTGLLYIGDAVQLDSLREGGTGTQSELEEQPDTLPDKYESGTSNSVGISGLGAGMKYLLQEGLDNIVAHEEILMGLLIDGLEQIPNVAVYAAPAGIEQMPVVSCIIDGYTAGEVGILLDQAFDIKVRSGLHCSPAAHKTLGTYPGGTVRFSPGCFTTQEDINRTIEAVQAIATARV